MMEATVLEPIHNRQPGGKMKKALTVFMAILCCGCTSATPEQVVVEITATPRLITATPQPATSTPEPTQTPLPTPTPDWEIVAITAIEDALGANGHLRYPISTGDGQSAFHWVKGNPYGGVTTFEDGRIQIQVLHEKSPEARTKAIEGKLAALDQIFPDSFMAELRAEHEAYNRTVPTKVGGEPDDVIRLGDEWHTVWAEYYTDPVRIDGYAVFFSLVWWQSTCPEGYYCWYEYFPGLDFTGDSSFVFYTILIEPLQGGGVIQRTT